jgi:hypothetical protein
VPISDRIAVLKQELGISSNRALEKGGLPGDEWVVSNGLLDTWKDKDPSEFTTSSLERFLNYWGINKDWWRTGKGDPITKKPTPAIKSTDNMEKGQYEGVYQTIVEGRTEYVLIPRSILSETQLVSTEQINKTWAELAEKNRELERKNKQLDFYQEQFAKLMDNLELSPKSPKPKEV